MLEEQVKAAEQKAASLDNRVVAIEEGQKVFASVKLVDDKIGDIAKTVEAIKTASVEDHAKIQLSVKEQVESFFQDQREKSRQESLKAPATEDGTVSEKKMRFSAYRDAYYEILSDEQIKNKVQASVIDDKYEALEKSYVSLQNSMYSDGTAAHKHALNSFNADKNNQILTLGSEALHTIFGTQEHQNLTSEQISLASERFGDEKIRFGFSPSISSPELYDRQFIGYLEKCFYEPASLLGSVSKQNISKNKYRARYYNPQMGFASFETNGKCTPQGNVNAIQMPNEIQRSVKGLSSLFCVHMDDLEEMKDIDLQQEIRDNLARQMINSMEYESMTGASGAFEGILPNINKFDVLTSNAPPPIGSFITWQNLTQARAGLIRDARKKAKIYSNSSGFVNLLTTTNAFGDLSNAVTYSGDSITIMGMKFEYNDYLPVPSQAWSVTAPLLPSKVNFIVGDLEMAYKFVTRKSARIARFDPVNGGTCVIFQARGLYDGFFACKNAIVGLQS